MSIDWLEPEATVRGSVIVIAGRGEHAGVYARFARRIAFDGYRVSVIDATHDVIAGLDAARGALAAADSSLPVVVVGSDSGATAALSLAASEPVVTGVVAAGLLVDTENAAPPQWSDELEVRSACPVHRAVLDSADSLDQGALATTAVPVGSDLLSGVRVPALLIHGSADAVSAADRVQDLADALPDGRIAIVADGRHDILNDVSHRSVAAEIVQFVERLRLPGNPEIIVRVPVGALAER